MLGLSLVLFAVSALLEGAITVAVVGALDRIRPGFIRQPGAGFRAAWGALALSAVLLSAVGVLFAAASPDGLEHLAQQVGIAGRAKTLLSSPLADYQAALLPGAWMPKAAAGLAGLALIYAVCLGIGRLARGRST
jgi:hypothetical protein